MLKKIRKEIIKKHNVGVQQKKCGEKGCMSSCLLVHLALMPSLCFSCQSFSLNGAVYFFSDHIKRLCGLFSIWLIHL